MIRIFGIVALAFTVAFCATRDAHETSVVAVADAGGLLTIEQMMRVREADLAAIRIRILAGDTLFTDLKTPDSFSTGQVTEHTADMIDEHFHEMSELFVDNYVNMIEAPDKAKQFNIVVRTCYSCHETYCPGPLRQIKALLIEE